MKKYTIKTRIRLMLFSVGAILSFGFFVYTFFNSFMKVYNNKKEVTYLTKVLNEKREEEEQLKLDIGKLKDSEYLARYTRERYLYSGDNEIIIKLDE